jgi:K(+)-stimulated pyrophosphate-energized sodium pump
MQGLEILGLISAGSAILTAALAARSVLRRPTGSGRMVEVGEAIKDGARAFLRRQYTTVGIFVLLASLLFLVSPNFGPKASLAYLCGSLSSMAAGYFGMQIAIRANTRTAHSALSGLDEALKVAFRAGLVMGMLVVGLGMLAVLGITLGFDWLHDPSRLLPLSFGASSVALFGRVGGGIYTKTADVGADLVGKIEKGIPEDDPRNPAVIADNVGDNVGDVAGMGSDLYESYVEQIVATMIVGAMLGDVKYALFPIGIAAAGIFSSIVASFMVRVRRGKDPSYVLNSASFASMVFTAISVFLLVRLLFGSEVALLISIVLGLISGLAIGLASDYFTNRLHKPAQYVARSASSGTAINILSGFSVGLFSLFVPVLVISASVVVSYAINSAASYGTADSLIRGIYGICLAGMGMLSVTGMVVSADAYGPVADNAGGIIEQCGEERARETTDALDSVGNTMKAISKGFAIGSAALTAIALFASYSQVAHLKAIDLLKPEVVAGAMIGAAVISLFCALVILAVSRNAFRMVEEVRRQFREIPGLMEGKAKPDYGRCVDIATTGALRELIVPALLVILSPILVGVSLGSAALGGMQLGAILLGLVFALLMANAGAAWDNAKKFIELGNLGGKGTPTHQAAVVGDTVGDPFKDTAGPSLNIAIKLMSVVALLMALGGVV